MKDKKKIEILSKVIERVYNKNPGIQKLIYESMLDICKEEGGSPEQVCIFASLCFWLYHYGLSKHNVLCVQRTAYENTRVCFYW